MNNKNEFMKFIIAGAWNTVFGYTTYAIIFYLFPLLHYMIVLVLSNIISTVNAYLCYKLFVFKTKGKYFKEYPRFYFINGISQAVNFVFLPLMVELFHVHPLISQGVILFAAAMISYVGHKKVTFS